MSDVITVSFEDVANRWMAYSEELEKERDELRAQLADAIAFVRKAGHLPGCGRRKHCAVCNAPPFAFTHSTNRADSHPYKEGPCTCGHDRIVGSEGE